MAKDGTRGKVPLGVKVQSSPASYPSSGKAQVQHVDDMGNHSMDLSYLYFSVIFHEKKKFSFVYVTIFKTSVIL